MQKTAYEMRISDWSSDVCSSDRRRHARAVEKMGMALRGRQHASGFAIGLAEVAIGSAGGEAALRLHGFELGGEGLRSEGEPVAQRGKGSCARRLLARSEEHTSELQSLMRISYAVFCLKNKNILIL